MRPEGTRSGRVGALGTFARVNAFGFSESPSRKVVNGRVTEEIVYLAADEEEEYVVAQANAALNPDGTFKNDRVLVRRSPQAASLSDLKLQLERDVFFGATTEISSVPPEEVQLMDESPTQIVSVATPLIPFLEPDDAHRALWGANLPPHAGPHGPPPRARPAPVPRPPASQSTPRRRSCPGGTPMNTLRSPGCEAKSKHSASCAGANAGSSGTNNRVFGS